MPQKPHRPRVDSVAGQLEVMAGARRGRAIGPPASVPLTAEEMAFYRAVIEELSLTELTPHIAMVAALLARTMADLERQSRALRDEDAAPGGPRANNPRRNTVLSLLASVLAQRRSLQIHGRAKNGHADDAATRRAQVKAIEAAAGLDDDDEDDFLAKPH